MFERNPIRPARPKSEGDCKIKIRKKPDGTIEKSISKNCTPAQIRALMNRGDITESDLN